MLERHKDAVFPLHVLVSFALDVFEAKDGSLYLLGARAVNNHCALQSSRAK